MVGESFSCFRFEELEKESTQKAAVGDKKEEQRMKAILFDLDGTLLPMEQETFTKMYFKALAGKLAPCGYDAAELTKAVWKGTAAMVANDGSRSNEDVFWDTFAALYGTKAYKDRAIFDDFYRNDFDSLKDVCGYVPQAGQLVKKLKESGHQIILASNPIFPMVAQEKRMVWAGLEVADFVWITSYENSSYCKPNPQYYLEIAGKIGCEPKECLLVGNHATEDMVAKEAGMQVFLLTDCLINSDDKDISQYPRGNFGELQLFLKEL